MNIFLTFKWDKCLEKSVYNFRWQYVHICIMNGCVTIFTLTIQTLFTMVFTQVFGHLNSLTYLYWNLNKYIYYLKLCLKIVGWVTNSVDTDEMPHSAASHLDIHCLLRPVCPNTYGKYGAYGMLSNMSKMHRFRSSCTCAEYQSGICSPFIHSVVSNYFVSKQWRPWLDCTDAQADLGIRYQHMPKDTFWHGAVLIVLVLKCSHEQFHVSGNIKKCSFGHVHPTKIHISLHIHTVWSKSSLGTFWIAEDAKFLTWTVKTDQTVQMRRLIWVFLGCTCQKVHFLMFWLI